MPGPGPIPGPGPGPGPIVAESSEPAEPSGAPPSAETSAPYSGEEDGGDGSSGGGGGGGGGSTTNINVLPGSRGYVRHTYHGGYRHPVVVQRTSERTIVRSPRGEWGAAEWIAVAIGAAVIAGLAGYLIHSSSAGGASRSGKGRGGRGGRGKK